jgi:prepilin-type N-terminal cleavage/methylation domain-containing protein
VDIQDMTTKGTTTMFERYRRIQREIQEEQAQGDEGGFTLIELLIVIVVLGILAAVTVFGLSNVTSQSLTSACHADAKSVAVAAEAFHAQNTPNYPTNIQTELVTIVNGNRYLRAMPGNTTKYTIALDPAGTGKVMVTNVKTGYVVDFEDPTTWTGYTGPGTGLDPCTGL